MGQEYGEAGSREKFWNEDSYKMFSDLGREAERRGTDTPRVPVEKLLDGPLDRRWMDLVKMQKRGIITYRYESAEVELMPNQVDASIQAWREDEEGIGYYRSDSHVSARQ